MVFQGSEDEFREEGGYEVLASIFRSLGRKAKRFSWSELLALDEDVTMRIWEMARKYGMGRGLGVSRFGMLYSVKGEGGGRGGGVKTVTMTMIFFANKVFKHTEQRHNNDIGGRCTSKLEVTIDFLKHVVGITVTRAAVS